MHNFISLECLGRDAIWKILARAHSIKKELPPPSFMKNKKVAFLFEKKQYHEELSFESAVNLLGGTISFRSAIGNSKEYKLQHIKDTIRMLQQEVYCIITDAISQTHLEEIICTSTIPILNASTEKTAPYQVMVDLFTIYEHTPNLNVHISWIGKGTNLLNSWIEAAMYLPFELSIAIPPGETLDRNILSLAFQVGAKIFLTQEPSIAATQAHYIYRNMQHSDTTEFYTNAQSVLEKNTTAHLLNAHMPNQKECALDTQIVPTLIKQQTENRLPIQQAILEHIVS